MALYLVTGGAGFIGSHTVEELVRRGESVRVLDDLSTGRKENLSSVLNQIDFRQGDIRDLEAIRPLFEGVNYVIHFAAASSVLRSIKEPVETTEVNLMGTLHVLVAARDAHVKRMVMAATGAIYGDNPVLPRVETQMPDPLSPYAIVKLAGEYFGQVFHRLFGLEFVALRYFNIFGPRQNPLSPYSGVLSKFVRAYLSGITPTIHGTGEQSRDFTYVANVVDATMRACQALEAPGKVMNVGTGRGTSLNRAIQILNQILGVQVTPHHDPPRVGDFMHSTADIALARTVLGYEPSVTFEEGLRRTVGWMRTTLL
ncbi:MAG TPA: SDR family oxidoreductase [Terriglobia bacterium]|nr:SDR family oxidoreductase [Terriglobia bacterium]